MLSIIKVEGKCPESMEPRDRRVSIDAIDNCRLVTYRLPVAEWQ